MNLNFNCPACKNPLTVDESAANQQCQCPYCNHIFIVPSPPIQGNPPIAPVPNSAPNYSLICPYCGVTASFPIYARNQNVSCPQCGRIIPQQGQGGGVVQQPVSPANNGPIQCGPFYFPRNKPAVWAYYLGIASLAFCLLTGIPALIMGIIGLVHAKKHPEGRGTGHALFGLIMGLITISIVVLFICLNAF